MKEELLLPDQHILYRGVAGFTKRKYNNKLVKTNSEYNTIYFTNNYNYAVKYAEPNDNGINNGVVTEWTPKRPLKILVLNSIVLRQIKNNITNTELPNKLINEIIGKSYLTRKGYTVENLKKTITSPMIRENGFSFRAVDMTSYNRFKTLNPKNIIYEKNRMSNKWNNAIKIKDSIKKKEINKSSLTKEQKHVLSYLALFHNHNVNVLKGTKKPSFNSDQFPLIKINNNKKGFSRVSCSSHDTYLYYYIMKYIKKLGYDGIKTITRGIKRNNGTTIGKVEYVFSAKGINTLFKRVDEIPQLRFNILNYMSEYNIKGLKGR